MEKDGSLAGVFTARDILRYMDKVGQLEHGGMASALNKTVGDLMTRKENIVFCSPNDTSRKCREMMFQTKVRNMPVIDNGEVLGIISQKDLADSAFSLSDDGGKKGYFRNVTGRKGIPEGTKIAASKGALASHIPLLLDCDIGACEIPHPYKSAQNVASSRRQFGPGELSTDNSLCEDAHFALALPDPVGGPKSVYVCVADGNFVYMFHSEVIYSCGVLTFSSGVGSWRQFGVDPRNFAHKLVENAKQAVELNYQLRQGTEGDIGALLGISNDRGPIHPLDVIIDAWNATTDAEITGSSTICVATLDAQRNQLSYSNLGDCGLVVVRHIDSETAGYMVYFALHKFSSCHHISADTFSFSTVSARDSFRDTCAKTICESPIYHSSNSGASTDRISSGSATFLITAGPVITLKTQTPPRSQ
jgi:protein phosphatase PTC7